MPIKWHDVVKWQGASKSVQSLEYAETVLGDKVREVT